MILIIAIDISVSTKRTHHLLSRRDVDCYCFEELIIGTLHFYQHINDTHLLPLLLDFTILLDMMLYCFIIDHWLRPSSSAFAFGDAYVGILSFGANTSSLQSSATSCDSAIQLMSRDTGAAALLTAHTKCLGGLKF